jgi:hypothetical protein
MEYINPRLIKLDKPLNDLDKWVLKFIRILQKHTDYVIISGYVSLLFGRSRSTEDIDLFIKPITKEVFSTLYHELKDNGYWCLNAESDNEVYSYLEDKIAIRFANKGESIPNMEVKVARKLVDTLVFTDFIEVQTKEGIINISSLERQIAFKRYCLCSDKDLEDAHFIEMVFKEHINHQKIKEYKDILDKNET